MAELKTQDGRPTALAPAAKPATAAASLTSAVIDPAVAANGELLAKIAPFVSEAAKASVTANLSQYLKLAESLELDPQRIIPGAAHFVSEVKNQDPSAIIDLLSKLAKDEDLKANLMLLSTNVERESAKQEISQYTNGLNSYGLQSFAGGFEQATNVAKQVLTESSETTRHFTKILIGNILPAVCASLGTSNNLSEANLKTFCDALSPAVKASLGALVDLEQIGKGATKQYEYLAHAVVQTGLPQGLEMDPDRIKSAVECFSPSLTRLSANSALEGIRIHNALAARNDSTINLADSVQIAVEAVNRFSPSELEKLHLIADRVRPAEDREQAFLMVAKTAMETVAPNHQVHTGKYIVHLNDIILSMHGEKYSLENLQAVNTKVAAFTAETTGFIPRTEEKFVSGMKALSVLKDCVLASKALPDVEHTKCLDVLCPAISRIADNARYSPDGIISSKIGACVEQLKPQITSLSELVDITQKAAHLQQRGNYEVLASLKSIPGFTIEDLATLEKITRKQHSYNPGILKKVVLQTAEGKGVEAELMKRGVSFSTICNALHKSGGLQFEGYRKALMEVTGTVIKHPAHPEVVSGIFRRVAGAFEYLQGHGEDSYRRTVIDGAKVLLNTALARAEKAKGWTLSKEKPLSLDAGKVGDLFAGFVDYCVTAKGQKEPIIRLAMAVDRLKPSNLLSKLQALTA